MRLACLIAVLLAAPAAGQSPAVTPAQYEAARGAPLGQAAQYVWAVSVEGDDEGAQTRAIDTRLGEDWAWWRAQGQPAQLVDMRAARFLTLTPGAEGAAPTVINSSLYAEARRRIDIYAGLSEGGSREQIAFGPGQIFHRIWLESAMGVASQSGALEIGQDGRAVTARHDGALIARMWFAPGPDSLCEIDPPARLDAAIAMLRHAAPLHPDLIAAIRQMGAPPCALQFRVVSPDSPQGRSERWVLTAADSATDDEAQPGQAVLPASAAPLLPRADLIAEAGEVARAAVRGEAGAPPDKAAFYQAMLARRGEGDLAGAFLTTVQETHHFGPCPEQAIGSARLTCAEINALTRAGVGDAAFERALEGVTAMRQGDHAVAVDRLARFIDRDDYAGAAARIVVANELIAWGREGLESRPDLDPAALLSEALILDPYAPDAYWHLGRRYLEAGAPHAAWAFFDLGRALPGRTPTPLLSQAGPLEQRLSALAPDLAPAPDVESGDHMTE